jgi:chaperone modulatory protein CbpM
MTELYSESQTLIRVTRLTRARLASYVAAEVVVPIHTPDGPAFRPADIARLDLLCELAEEFEMQDEALAVVATLIDRLHAARGDLRALCQAIEAEPPEVRARIGAAWRQAWPEAG